MKNKKINQSILVSLCILVIAIAIFFFFTHDSAYKMPSDGFQISVGTKNKIEKGTEFVFKSNGTTFKNADSGQYLTASPLYFDNDSKRIVIPQDLIYVEGRKASFKKVAAFKEFSTKDGLTYDGNVIMGGFLFDGVNTYTFLEKMEITVNGETFEIDPFSTVTVTDDVYYLYNTKNKEVKFDYLQTSNLTAKNSDYSVDLLNSIFYTSSEDKVLIYTKIDNLDELK